MTKSYDSIIGSVLNSLSDLRQFVEENEPSRAGTVRAIQQEIQLLDYYMAYGEEPEPLVTREPIAGLDWMDSLSILDDLSIRNPLK